VEGAIFYYCDQSGWTDHATVSEKLIKLSGKNCYGQVEHASITIRGLVLPASVSRNMDEWGLFAYSLFLEPDEEEHLFRADVRLEEYTFDMHVESPVRSLRRSATEADQLVERVPTWILSLGHSVQRNGEEGEPRYYEHCLILAPSPTNPTAYERLGYGRIDRGVSWDWKNYFEKKDSRPLLSFEPLDLIYLL
jgi:hypothetical protein